MAARGGGAIVLALLLIGAARLVARAGRRLGSLVAVGLPMASVGLVAAVNFITHDASPGAQAVAVLAVLYAAYELRPAGAVLVTAAGVACQQATAWAMLEPACRSAMRSTGSRSSSRWPA